MMKIAFLALFARYWAMWHCAMLAIARQAAVVAPGSVLVMYRVDIYPIDSSL